MSTLVVRQPFGDYAVGQEITDPEAVEKLLASHPHYVVMRREPTDEEQKAAAAAASKDAAADAKAVSAKS